MIITPSIIYFKISEKYSLSQIQLSSDNLSLDGVRVITDKGISDNYIYILDSKTSLPRMDKNSVGTFVITDKNRNITEIKKTCNYIILDNDVNSISLLEDISDMINALQKWDNTLKQAINDNTPLHEFMPLGFSIINQNYFLLDRNLSVIYSTKKNKTSKIITPRQADNILNDNNYRSSLIIEEHYIYSDIKNEKYFLCKNISIGVQYLARLILPLKNESADPGLIKLFLHFFEYTRSIYLRNTNDPFVHHQADRMHKLFKTILFEDNALMGSRVAEILHEYGWKAHHDYYVIKFSFLKYSKWDEITNYICKQLEESWPNSCAIKKNDTIVWIFNNSIYKEKDTSDSFYNALAYIVRDFACKAGVSNMFSRISELTTYYKQAEVALEVGESHNPYSWYFKFDDYTLDYMLEQLTKEFSSEQLCHKGLRKLIEYDKINKTEYTKTLQYYLKEGQNTTHAAESLFIHRTTLIRRLERIREIAHIDFNNSNEILYLTLSLMIMSQDN